MKIVGTPGMSHFGSSMKTRQHADHGDAGLAVVLEHVVNGSRYANIVTALEVG